MNSLIIFILALSFLPIEILRTPIPITIVTLVSPIAILFTGLSRTKEVRLATLSLTMGAILALASSLQIQSPLPIFSFFSFFSPIIGLYLAFSISTKPHLITKFIKLFWLPGTLMGIAMAINLINYSGSVRGTILVSNELNGDFLGSTALGSLLGLDLFAAYGVNSLAGICLSFSFLLGLSFFFQKSNLTKFFIIASLTSILWYGGALGSRAFYLGIFSFAGVIILSLQKNRLITYLIISILIMLIIWVFAQNPRVISTLQSLQEGDIKALTSNRSELWGLFINDAKILFGSAFKPIRFSEFGSSSYHLYVFSLIGKAGIIVAFPLIILIYKSLIKKPFILFGGWPDLIIIGGSYSFLIQSLVWDIYAVQLYGHIAWFFLGLKLIGQRKP